MMTPRPRRRLVLFVAGVMAMSAAAVGAPAAAQNDDTAPATGDAQPVPPSKGPIEPGRYHDASAGPPIEFTLGEGWQVLFAPAPQVGVDFALADNEAAELNLVAYTGRLFGDPCWNEANQETYATNIKYASPRADGLVEYLTTHPSMVATASETTLGGLPADQVDFEIAVGEGCYKTLGIWHLGPFYYTTEDGFLGRAVAADTEFGTLVALIVGPPEDYPTLLEQATATLDTLEFPDEGT